MNSSSVFPMPSSPPSLTHSVNTSGNLGMFVNPYSCGCEGCKDYLSGPSAEDESGVANVGAGEQPQSDAVAVLTATEEIVMVPRDKLAELRRLQERFEEQWFAAGGGTLRSPSLGGTSTTWYLGAGLEEIQERCRELGLPEYSPPTYKPPVPMQVSKEEIHENCRVLGIPFGKQATEPALSSTTLEDMRREWLHPKLTVQPSRLRSADRCPAYGCENPTTCACPRAEPIALPSEDNRPSRFRNLPSRGIPPAPRLVRVNAFTDCLGRGPFEPVNEYDVMQKLKSLRASLQLQRDRMPCDIDDEEAVAVADRKQEELAKKIKAIEDVLQTFGAPFHNE
jgi:hypothetical protein